MKFTLIFVKSGEQLITFLQVDNFYLQREIYRLKVFGSLSTDFVSCKVIC